MEAVRLDLPPPVIDNIHGFASDKLDTHPAAQLIKELNFEYRPEENRHGRGVYKPERLSISANQAHP